MCVNYQIHWVCDHVVPLDREPTKCTTYLASEAKTNPTARATCPLGLTYEGLQSDEVCPACATKFLNLTERALGREMARKEGKLVDEMDLDVGEMQQAMDAWVAKQKVLREKVEVVLIMAGMGVVEEEMLNEWLRQIGVKEV